MSFEPRLIAPFKNTGLNKYWKPWIIGEEAFPQILNAYPWRGTVRKREGYSRLGVMLTNPCMGIKNWINPQNFAQTLVCFSTTKAEAFNDGTGLFQDITKLSDGPHTAFSFSGSNNQYFWTTNYSGSLWVTNNKDNMYYWNGILAGGFSVFQPTVSGTNQLLKSLIIIPYKGRLVCLNTTETGNINYSNRARWSQIGTPYSSNVTSTNITGYTPSVSPTVLNVGSTSGFVVGQKAGITLINQAVGTLLNGNQYNVSAIGVGTISIDVDTSGFAAPGPGFSGTAQGPGTVNSPPAPFSIDIFGWRDDIPGRGGYIDADTNEQIVSAGIVKDTLIVFFQRSTWRLRYVGSELFPFIWERLNTQYGAESTFSSIEFDDAVFTFSRYGWIASNTNDVLRIDMQIPDDSFGAESSDTNFTGLSHIQGIRDYYRQMAYWTFPTISNTNANEIYAYNYLDKNWSIFAPTAPIRTFGYYKASGSDVWQTQTADPENTWPYYNDPWTNYNFGGDINFPFILGGDVNGNIFKMFEFFDTDAVDKDTSNNPTNFNFQITTKRFNPYLDKGMRCYLGFVDVYCSLAQNASITVEHFVDDQDVPIQVKTLNLNNQGIITISAITPGNPNTTITTSVNHNLKNGQNVVFSSITGSMSVLNGKTLPITVVNATQFTIAVNTIGEIYVSGGYIYSVDITKGDAQYSRIYFNSAARNHQLTFTLSDAQLADPYSGTAQFELQGLVVWTKPLGRIKR